MVLDIDKIEFIIWALLYILQVSENHKLICINIPHSSFICKYHEAIEPNVCLCM